MLRRFLPAVLAAGVFAAAAAADAQKPTYDDDVLPVLKQHCVLCHSNDKQKGGLNLSTFAAMAQGGSSGVVMVAGDTAKSRIYTLTAHTEEPKMPPSGSKIPDQQINIIRTWVEQGGRENAGSKAAIAKPKMDIGLKSVVKGRPEGPPPMPLAGKLATDPAVRGRRPGAVLAMAASPWAPVVAVGGPKQVLLYHTDTAELLGLLPYPHGQINSLKFSRSGRLLLAAGGHGGQSGKATLYNVETGAVVVEVGSAETDAILAADISADQTQIAVGTATKMIRVYSTADGSVLRDIKKHTDWVTSVEYSPDGVLLATGDRNGGLFVWESFTGREYFSLRGHTAMISDISWRDDSNVLATASEDGSIRLWEMENGNPIKNWAAHGGGAAAVRFSHDGKLASTGRDRVTKLWDQNGGLVKQFEAFPDLGLRAVVTHDNAKVFAGDWSGVVKGWAAADAKLLVTADTNPPTAADRLKAAEMLVAAADAKAAQANGVLVAAKAAADKATGELAAVQKLLTDTTGMANAAKAAVGPAKAEADKQTAALAATQAAEAAKAVTTQALNEAAAKVQAEAAKAPQNADLKAQAAKVAEIAKAAAAELELAKKATVAAAAAVKAATDKYAAVTKTAGDTTTAAAALQQKFAADQAARKPAFDAVAAAQGAATAATAEAAAARATLDKLKATAKK